MAPQPIPESALLSDYLEPTNEGYALAKISALKYCQYLKREKGVNFISVMPTNLYGPNDNFDYETSHVLPALLRRFHDAKQQNLPHVTIWGSGKPLREFLYIDDLADAILFLMENYDEEEHINVGSGEEVSISDLAGIIADVVGYKGQIVYDKTKPDGTPRKLLDVSKLTKLGWKASTSLREGIEMTYDVVTERF
jgi:GDP-L-fucose synthase